MKITKRIEVGWCAGPALVALTFVALRLPGSLGAQENVPTLPN